MTVPARMSINGFEIGDGSPYTITNAELFLDLPSIKNGDITLIGVDGIRFNKRDILGSKQCSVSMMIKATGEQELITLLDNLKAACLAPGEISDFIVRWPHRGSDELIQGRVRALTFPNAGETYGFGHTRCELLFVSERSYAMSASEKSAVASVNNSVTDGRTYPRTYPITYLSSGVATGTVYAKNEGNVPTDPIFEVHGPMDWFRIDNTATGEKIEYREAFGSGDIVKVDVFEPLTTLNDIVRAGRLTTDSRMFRLQPGNNTIQFNGVGTGTLVVKWRDGRA